MRPRRWRDAESSQCQSITLRRGAEKIAPVEEEQVSTGRDHHIRRIGLAVRQHQLPRCCATALLAVRDLLSPIAYPRSVATHDLGDVATKRTSGTGSGERPREGILKLIGKREVERFRSHIDRHASGVQGVYRLRKLLQLFTCEAVPKVRSCFDEFGDHDRSTVDTMDDLSTPTTSGRENELIARIPELASGFVARWEVALAITADTDPPRTSSIAPAVAASRNEGRSRLTGVEFGGEQLGEFADIDRRIGQKHRSMLGRGELSPADRTRS